MQYWWVNQNQTHRQEIGGGYMWSPKTNSNGKYNPFYNNMKLACVGDLVFAFYQSKVQMIGVVEAAAFSSRKPDEFGSSGANWSNNGWQVPVSWVALPNPIRPKNHMSTLGELLPSSHSPIRSDGTGNQAYLFAIPDAFGEALIRLTNFDTQNLFDVKSSSAKDEYADKIETEIKNDVTIDATYKDAVVKSRRGQGKFKANLIMLEVGCRVTGIKDKRFLIASHIKGWASCETNQERLDGNNGLLLAPNIDKIFDNGFISFEDNGDILVSSKIDQTTLNQLGLDLFKKPNVGSFTPAQRSYLAFHRQNTFNP